jgi:hypothetical protein
MSEVHLRLVQPYTQWPWRLAQTLDPRLSQADRRQVADDFVASRGCCLDTAFSGKLRAKVHDPQELLIGPLHQLLKLHFASKIINVEIETNFARASAQRQVMHGRSHSVASMAAKHVLAELASQQAICSNHMSPGTLPGIFGQPLPPQAQSPSVGQAPSFVTSHILLFPTTSSCL